MALCETRSSLNPGSLLCQVEASLSHQQSGSVLGQPRWLFQFLLAVSVRSLKHPAPQAPALHWPQVSPQSLSGSLLPRPRAG